MPDLSYFQREKQDITQSLKEVDRLLLTDISPLQRQILTNYRRHSRAENSGNWERIFDDGMLVDEPHYVLQFGGKYQEVKGKEALRNFYRNIGAPVIFQVGQEIHLAAQAFTSYSVSVNYVTGTQLAAMGQTGEDPDGFFIRYKQSLTFWPFDSQGRLVGEFGGELGPVSSMQIPRELFVSPEEAREKLTPLIGQLPVFPGDMVKGRI